MSRTPQEIRAIRERLSLSRPDLSNMTGVHVRRLERLEAGRTITLTDRERGRLISALSLDPTDLSHCGGPSSHLRRALGLKIVPQARLIDAPPVGAPQHQYIEGDPLPNQSDPKRPIGFGSKAQPAEVDRMLWRRKARLMRKELKALGLRANPFPDRIPGEQFWHDPLTNLADTILDIMDEGGMAAISSESGAGKSTLFQHIRGELLASDYVVVDLAALERQSLGAWTMETAILEALGERKLPNNSNARVKLLGKLLSQRAASGGRTAIIADDFHDAGTKSIKLLRRLREQDPKYFLFSLLLGGQEGLGIDLKSESLREISGRTTILEMPPLVDDDAGYNFGPAFLNWHMDRVSKESLPERYFTEAAACEIARRGIVPMATRNLAIHCLKEVAELGRAVDVDVVDAITRRMR